MLVICLFTISLAILIKACFTIIVIKDLNENVLYSEKVKGENVTRNYRLDVDEFDLTSPDFALTVQVTTAKTHETAVFHVKSTDHVVENYEVAKL